MPRDSRFIMVLKTDRLPKIVIRKSKWQLACLVVIVLCKDNSKQ